MSNARATPATAGNIWFKSSYSSNEGGACVEVAVTEQAVQVRDSKDISETGLTFGHTDWTRFVRYAAGT